MRDIINEHGKIVGVKLADDTVVRSRVVVTADGILAKLSAKTEIPVNKNTQEYIQYQTLFYERPKGLTSGFAYLFGDLKLDDDFPPAVGGVGVGHCIEISLILYSKTKHYPLNKPMDYYTRKLLKGDKRIPKYIGGNPESLKYLTLKGTRLRIRELCKENAVDGAVAIGDNWATAAQLGNVNALANGVYAGREIKKAFERNDLSKEWLNRVSHIINKDVETYNNNIGKMTRYPVLMDEKTIEKYFEVFSSLNYPTFFYGSKKRLVMRIMGFVLKRFHKLIINPKMFKYI